MDSGQRTARCRPFSEQTVDPDAMQSLASLIESLVDIPTVEQIDEMLRGFSHVEPRDAKDEDLINQLLDLRLAVQQEGTTVSPSAVPS